MRKSQISASMMCSNLVDLQATIDVFEKEKVEYLHIDVMDGEFVPNFGLGVDYIRGLRELTSIPLDLHLMIKDPEYKLPWIGIHKEDIVTIHYESTFQVQRALDYLVPYGCKRFLAINPATPIGQIEEVLDYIDGVNLLMVNPGFAGQKIVPSTLRKAEKAAEISAGDAPGGHHFRSGRKHYEGARRDAAFLWSQHFCGGNFEHFLHRCIALRRKNPGIPESSGIRKRTAFPGCTV